MVEGREGGEKKGIDKVGKGREWGSNGQNGLK